MPSSIRSERERLEPEAAPATPPPAPVLDARLTPASVLALQRAGAGNHAIARTLARSSGGLSNSFAALSGQQPKRTQKPKTTQPQKPKVQTPRAEPKLQQAVAAPITSFVQTQKPVKPKTPVPTLPPETDEPKAARTHLVGQAVNWVPHLEHARSQVPELVGENGPLLKGLDDVLKEMKNAKRFNGHDPQKAVDQLRELYKLAGLLVELSAPVPPAQPTGANAPDALFALARQNIRLRMATEPWSGDAKGGVLDFEVDPTDREFHRKLRDEFHHKPIARTNWTGQQRGEQAYYYVTASSKSGYAYDVSAHALPKNKAASDDNLGRTVHVLHIRKQQ